MTSLFRPPILCCHSFNIPPLVSPTCNCHPHTLSKYYANWDDLSLPLSPSLLPLPPPPLSLLSLPLLLPPTQFPPLPKLIVVCACHCHCHHSHCRHSCCCHCSHSRCCCHCRCHCCCRCRSRCHPLHHCLTTTLQLSIAATIECRFHPPLPSLLLPSIVTIKRQCTQLSIAAVISLVAGHFLHQSLTAALRRYRFQPTPAAAVPVNGWLLFVCWIAPHLIHLPPLCDCQRSHCPSPLPSLSPPTLIPITIALFIALVVTRPPPLSPSLSPS
jgi:hypothetical protein